MNWVRMSVLIIIMASLGWAEHDRAFELNEEGLRAAARNDQAEAERLFNDAIAAWRAKGKDYEAHLATTLSNLGMTLCAEARRRACAAALEESASIFRRTLGLNNDRTLTSINFLGGVCLMLEENARARALFEEVLPVERQFFPADIQLSRTLGGLAAVHTQSGELQEALKLAEESLQIAIRSEGEDSVDTALEYANVAEIHRITGQRDRALPLFRKAQAIYEKQLGPVHPRVASLLSQQGLILMDDNKLGLASEAMEKARRMLESSCSGCDFEKSILFSNLGMLRLKQHRYAAAEDLLTRALSLQEKYSSHPSVNMAATLRALSDVRRYQKRYDEADRLKQRAQTIMSFQ